VKKLPKKQPPNLLVVKGLFAKSLINVGQESLPDSREEKTKAGANMTPAMVEVLEDMAAVKSGIVRDSLAMVLQQLILFNLVHLILECFLLNLFTGNLPLRCESGFHSKLWQYVSLQ